MRHILAIDGNSLGHRAYHSTRHEVDLGPHTVAGAFVSMVAAVWSHGPYDGLVVTFDHPVNRRKLEVATYKANRVHDPHVTAAIQGLQADLVAADVLVASEHGAEADDLLAAVVDHCGDRNVACDVLSSDRDLIALVDDHARLLRPQASFAQLLVEDRRAIQQRWGIEPHQYPDLAALRGDPSDGLDGVPGIGDKTAARLIRDYGSVLGVYAAISDLSPRLEASLRAARAIVERNLTLMAPLPHLDVDLARCRLTGDRIDRLEAALTGWGELGAARRFRRAVTQDLAAQPPKPPPPTAPPPGT